MPVPTDERSPIGEMLNKTMKREFVEWTPGPALQMEVASVLI
jgi:hypothetical protein